MTKELKYRDLLKEKNCIILLFTNLINRFGDSVDAIAFTWLVYAITKSASWAAIIFGLNVLPNIIFQPFFGALAEKLDKKKVIIFTHLLRAAVITAFIFMYMKGIVNPYLMAAFSLVITTIESLNLPATMAIIPSIIKKEYISHAMSLNSSLSSAVALVGTGAAGIIIAKLGVETAMFIDVFTFLAAAVGTFLIKVHADVADNNADVADNSADASRHEIEAAGRPNLIQGKASYLSMLKDGFKYVAANRVILNYCLVAVMLNFFMVPINALQAPLAEDVYGLGSEFLSVFGMAASVGAIVGSLLIPKLMPKHSARKILIVCGLIMGTSCVVLSMGRAVKGEPVPGYLLGGLSVIAITMACSVISGTLSVQFVNTVDKEYLARASSVFGASATAAMPVGSMIISYAALHLSTGILIGAGGIMAIVLFAIIAFSNMHFDMEKPVREELADAA